MRVVSSATLPGWTSNACTLPRDRLGGIDRNHQRQGDTEAPSWGYPLVCTNPRNLNVGRVHLFDGYQYFLISG